MSEKKKPVPAVCSKCGHIGKARHLSGFEIEGRIFPARYIMWRHSGCKREEGIPLEPGLIGTDGEGI